MRDHDPPSLAHHVHNVPGRLVNGLPLEFHSKFGLILNERISPDCNYGSLC